VAHDRGPLASAPSFAFRVHAVTNPPRIAAALAAHPGAQQNFAAFPRFTQRSILEWIGLAKKPETRAQRITETASLAARNERANQWRPRP
jgi:uncharacterized protein YdeI (YjbR/CyaY-like superfamily)